MSDELTKQDTAVLKSVSTSDLGDILSEMRIVMIGGRQLGGIEASGKSSAGNIILGKDAFVVGRRTARSVQASACVHGRHVTVVDTPGWWWHYTTENTPKFDLLEIMRGPTLCPPGPHAFLLVIPVDSVFPNIYRMALESQLKFLSEAVWRHMIVLFSSVAPHDDIAFKNSLRMWPDLFQLLRKCQNKHVLNINNKDDNSQVIVLLEKIEKMVAQNNGHYFKIASSVSPVEMTDRERNKEKTLSMKTELHTHARDKIDHLTNMQILLLGASWDARSSAGNMILGKAVFEVDESRTTVSCAVSHAEVQGRELTVVDTPGWYCHSPLEKTSEVDRLEIVRSVRLCSPGPHAILLTVPIAIAFDKYYQRAVEEHMGLLGENVWSHTMVLFTRGDWLGDTTIEERIEAEGEHLQWLMEHCGNRYHVLNCKEQTDTTQVLELLEKIEEMVAENNGRHFVPELDGNPSIEYNLKMETAKTNMMKVGRKRCILQNFLTEKKNTLSEMRIVLLGEGEVGISKTGNTILQEHLFENSLYFKSLKRTQRCVKQEKKIEGYRVSVVNTPGWSTPNLTKAKEIVRSVDICTPGPHAFLLVLSAREPFARKTQQTVEDLMNLLGENAWRHAIIVFIDGFWLRDRPVEEYIACEGEALQQLLRRCGNRYHVIDNDWRNRSQVRNLLKMIEQTVARNRGEYFTFQRNKGKQKEATLTEDEWMKREDELIEKMLEAAAVHLDEEEFRKPFPRRRQSFEHAVPSMSGESISDSKSLCGEPQNTATTSKVSQWLLHPRYQEPSSEYETMSNTSPQDLTGVEMEDDRVDIAAANAGQ